MNRTYEYFKEISKIPRGSGNCSGIGDYLENFAKKNNLRYKRDAADNVIIFKDAAPGRENDAPVMIQGHSDMVCEKKETSSHDFRTDPITLIEDGDYVHADQTTLGGDDGFAVAMMLDFLSDESLDAPALECVFTTDEEIGMLGAAVLDMSECRAKYLINADSEDEGIFTCGCAGGAGLDFSIPVSFETKSGVFSKVTLKGLAGGHSGMEIVNGGLNAILTLAKIIPESVRLCEIVRMGKDNAIPQYCEAIVCGNTDDIRELFLQNLPEWQKTEKNISLDITVIGDTEKEVLTPDSAARVLSFLKKAPYGVKKMCEEPSGLVQTSDNIGIIYTDKNSVGGTFSVRSSVESEKTELISEIDALCKEYGGKTEVHGSYPGWEYKKDSKLRDVMCSVYKKMTGTDAKIDIIHAGLECGLILSMKPDLDIVSFGPELHDIHTYDERMSIPSALRMSDFAREVLKELRSDEA